MVDKKESAPIDEINKRIMQFLKAVNLKQNELAEVLDINASRISHIKSGRNKPNIEFIVKLITAFPHLNPNWLLLGKGPMYKSEEKENKASNTKEIKYKRENINIDSTDNLIKDSENQDNSTKPKNNIENTEQATEPIEIDQPTKQTSQKDMHSSTLSSTQSKFYNPNIPDRILILFPDKTFITYTERKN